MCGGKSTRSGVLLPRFGSTTPVAAETRSWRMQNGAYSAVLQTSETGGKRYIDKGWREK